MPLPVSYWLADQTGANNRNRTDDLFINTWIRIYT